MEKRPALGKGLSALIPDAPEPRISPFEVDIDRLAPNEFQPRGRLDPPRLEELARSIFLGPWGPEDIRRLSQRSTSPVRSGAKEGRRGGPQ